MPSKNKNMLMKKLLCTLALTTLLILPSYSAVEKVQETDPLSLVYYRDGYSKAYFKFFKRADMSAQEAINLLKTQVKVTPAHGFQFLVQGALVETEDGASVANVDA